MSNYVYSTLANSQNYHVYKNDDVKDLPKVVHTIHIKGGAGIATKHLVTPCGIVTQVSADDLELLEKNEVFLLHKKNGFIFVSTSKQEPEVVVADGMNPRDESSPVVPEDSDPNDKAQPVVEKASNDKKTFVTKKTATVKNSFK